MTGTAAIIADINYNTESITFLNIGLLVVPFNIQYYSIKCIRKITPGEEVIVLVYYKPLPKGRSFIFNLSNDGVMNIVIDYKSLKIVFFKNSTRGVRVI
ncbi:hypothetical protein QR685DRAFT_572390 [Neurospora intermedia]|uniref:Uncharacterized protein n=1 Tax=Neurospora intermedia TaxID=5142 RepID=A0ABR3D9L5_NEUIN